MSLQAYLAFVAACVALALLPGPVVTLLIANGLRHGTRAALINCAGAQAGLAIVIGIVAVGLTSLMATMGYWFDWVRFAGAAYLIWLGIKLFRAGGTLDAKPREDTAPGWKMLGHAWLVTALNPKSITFFVAFLPQFLDTKGDFWTQMLIFEATFITLAFANAMGYALIASRARAVVSNPRAIGLFNKAGGTLLIGAGVATVAIRSGSN